MPQINLRAVIVLVHLCRYVLDLSMYPPFSEIRTAYSNEPGPGGWEKEMRMSVAMPRWR